MSKASRITKKERTWAFITIISIMAGLFFGEGIMGYINNLDLGTNTNLIFLGIGLFLIFLTLILWDRKFVGVR